MSDNFWETNLSDEEDNTAPPSQLKDEPIKPSDAPKINVTLDDFPVSNWNSDNDARHIVEWYNNNRMAVEEKSLSFFKQASGVDTIYTRDQAQKLLDFVIQTLEEEGCTVWQPPSYTFHESPENIQITEIRTFGGLFSGWIFAGIWCLVSFIALFFIGGPVIADLGTSNWTPTDGVINDSGVDSSTDGEGGTTYCLWVEYDYTYEGRTYSGHVVSFSKDNSCSSWADEADEDYPPGEEVTVYVNPENPSEAVLEPGLSGVDWFVCCILPFPLIGIFLVVGMIKSSISAVTESLKPSPAGADNNQSHDSN